MMMGFSLQARLALLCALCGHDQHDDCDPIEVACSTAYGSCPQCKHPASEGQDTPKWRAKVDAWFKERQMNACDCIHDPEDHDPETGACLKTNPTFGPCPCAATSDEQRDQLKKEWKETR